MAPAVQGSRQLNQRWQQLETKHFMLIFPKDQKALAYHLADVAESRYQQVVDLCGFQPQGSIPLVLNPDTDIANAYAQSIFKKIEFYLAPPLDYDFGSGDKDWWTLVFLHEYAHLCQGMRDDMGVAHVLSTIFGQVNGLNFIAPRWWVEGVGVYTESVLTDAGRMNNSFYQLQLAADLLADHPWSRAQLANPPKVARPWGRNYFWGADLIAAVQDKHVPSVVDLVTQGQSDWPFWGLGEVWRTALGSSLELDWQCLQEKEKTAFHEKYPDRGLAIAETRIMTNEPDLEYKSPQWINSQQLVIFKNSLDQGKAIVTISIPKGNQQVWHRDVELQGHLEWQPQEKKLYFSELRANAFEPNARQAYPLWLQGPGQAYRLGTGKRLWSVSVSVRGVKAAIGNCQGQAGLLFQYPGEHDWEPLPVPAGAHFRDPRWSPDGSQLAVVVNIRGHQDICLLDPKEQRLLAITGWDKAADVDPAWSPDGQWLYFISDRSQGYQLFAWSLQTAQLYQVSHAQLGVFQPAISPDSTRVALVSYEKGFQQQLLVAPLDQQSWTLMDTTKPVYGWPPVGDHQDKPSSLPTAQPYNAWPYLAPTFWVPALGWGQEGLLLGAFSAQRDPLEFHEWQAQVLLALRTGRPYGFLSYHNEKWPLGWTLRAAYEPTNQVILGDGQDQRLGWGQRTSLTLALDTTLWQHLSRDWATVTSWQGTLGGAIYQADQEVAYPRALYAKTSLGFFHGQQGPKDFFPVQGFSFNLGWEQSLLKAWSNGQALTWGSAVYWPGLVQHQAWHLGLRGKKQSGHFSENDGLYAPNGFSQTWQGAGNQATFSLGYNWPLWFIDQGWSEWPVFFNDLWMTLTYDAGLTWEGTLDFPEQRHQAQSSLSLETTLDMTLFWYLTSAVRGTIIYRLENRDWLAQVGGQLWF